MPVAAAEDGAAPELAAAVAWDAAIALETGVDIAIEAAGESEGTDVAPKDEAIVGTADDTGS